MKRHLSAALLGLALLLAAGCRRDAAAPAASGTIETDEVRVASRYGGRVERIHAREGDLLTHAQLLAELDAPELRAQREEAAALLQELRAGPRPEEIAAARSEWEAIVAELALARLDEKRAGDLFTQRTIAEAERDRAASRAASLEKSAAAARSRYDLLLAGTRAERLAQAAARLEEIDTHLREMRVLAPTNCVLEILNVKVGDVLAPNQPLATLILTDRLWVRVYVPQPWLGRIQPGGPARVKADALPDREFSGVVEQVGRVAEFTPRNVQTPEERIAQVFPIKVRLPAGDRALRAGMSVDVWFEGPSAGP